MINPKHLRQTGNCRPWILVPWYKRKLVFLEWKFGIKLPAFFKYRMLNDIEFAWVIKNGYFKNLEQRYGQ